MTPKELAEEAWDELHPCSSDQEKRKHGIAIIQAAIEKATESLQTDLVLAQQMATIESKRANEAESRAAHASEEVEVCQSCGSPVDSGEEYCSWCNVETRDSR